MSDKSNSYNSEIIRNHYKIRKLEKRIELLNKLNRYSKTFFAWIGLIVFYLILLKKEILLDILQVL